MTEIYYGKTSIGQLLYDFCFRDLTDGWLAKKHGLPIAQVRRIRAIPSVRKLRKKIKREKLEGK